MKLTSLNEGEVRRWYRNYGYVTRITCEEGRAKVRWWQGNLYHQCEVIHGVAVDVPPRYWHGYQAIEGPAIISEVHDLAAPVERYQETADEDTAGVRW